MDTLAAGASSWEVHRGPISSGAYVFSGALAAGHVVALLGRRTISVYGDVAAAGGVVGLLHLERKRARGARAGRHSASTVGRAGRTRSAGARGGGHSYLFRESQMSRPDPPVAATPRPVARSRS